MVWPSAHQYKNEDAKEHTQKNSQATFTVTNSIRKMELHTCRLLKFVVDDRLEPFAVINRAAVAEHVVV